MRDGLIESTVLEAEKWVEAHKAVGILCSFGKDSLVLVHLLRHIKLPVVTCIPAHFDEVQWANGLRIVKDWGLTVAPLVQGDSFLREKYGKVVLMTMYGPVAWSRSVQPGTRCLLAEMAVKAPPADHGFDGLLSGQKNDDPDFLDGGLSVTAERKIAGTPDILHPLRDWTDSDVWEYVDKFSLPVDAARYDMATKKEIPDTAASNDQMHVCIACVDRRTTAPRVYCPKHAKPIVRTPDLVAYI